MTLTAFTTDDDLVQRRKTIMELGVDDFADQHLILRFEVNNSQCYTTKKMDKDGKILNH